MINLKIVCHGTLKEEYLRHACAEYMKRLSAYCQAEIIEIKDDEAFLKHLKDKEYIIALCIEGKELSSEEYAEVLKNLPLKGYSAVTLVIGGSEGLPEYVKKKSNLRLSFSKMTFPHQLMRIILLEQTYRAFNINNNGKYHK